METLLIRYLGAEDNEYTREVTRKTFVAAVARIYDPGCKFDAVLTLVGAQGIGKSRIINQMGGKWYSDTFGNVMTNQAMENIQGVWLMEMGELAGLKRAELETVKLFISKREDRFRVAYGKRPESFPRQNIFIGTTNDDTPLHDQSGGRRFWLVRVNRKNIEQLSEFEVDQLWAEAKKYYQDGEVLWLDNESIEDMAKAVQGEHTEQDDRAEQIAIYLDKLLPSQWEEMTTYERIDFLNGGDYGTATVQRDRVSLPEIWTELFGGKIKDMTPFATKFIRTIMKKVSGWEPKTIRTKQFSLQRGWTRMLQVLQPENES